MSKFGERLKQLREENHLLNKQLATELNVEPSTITNWEKGNRCPKDDILIKLADYFNCSVDYLLGRTDNKNSVVYSKEINNVPVVLELDKDYPYFLSAEDIINILKQLDTVGLDVEKLIKNCRNK